MRVFKLDGTSWIARPEEETEKEEAEPRSGWEPILFEADLASVAQRLVYRPAGWLAEATLPDLVAALDEAVVVRARWGATG